MIHPTRSQTGKTKNVLTVINGATSVVNVLLNLGPKDLGFRI